MHHTNVGRQYCQILLLKQAKSIILKNLQKSVNKEDQNGEIINDELEPSSSDDATDTETESDNGSNNESNNE